MLAIIIPTYNEKENIIELLDKINETVDAPYRLYVVDDNSPDGTGNLLESYKISHKNLIVIHREGKLGLGSAHLDAMKMALGNKHKFIITMDADFSHNPIVIENLIDTIEKENSDIVIGSRFIEGGGMVDQHLNRIFISKTANFCARFLVGLKIHDCTTAYRCYRSSIFDGIELDNHNFSNRYSFLIEVLFFFQLRHAKFSEIPIVFVNRLKGKTKVNFMELLFAGMSIMKLMKKRILRGIRKWLIPIKA